MRWRRFPQTVEQSSHTYHDFSGGKPMIRRTLFALCCLAGVAGAFSARRAQAQQAYGQQWGNAYSSHDWNRFYHYPFVYYPQNFWGNEYYRSSNSLYYRYPPEMQIPVYNKQWYNFYPSGAKYHSGHAFILDTF
jgi:hypothetical protein